MRNRAGFNPNNLKLLQDFSWLLWVTYDLVYDLLTDIYMHTIAKKGLTVPNPSKTLNLHPLKSNPQRLFYNKKEEKTHR